MTEHQAFRLNVELAHGILAGDPPKPGESVRVEMGAQSFTRVLDDSDIAAARDEAKRIDAVYPADFRRDPHRWYSTW